MFGFSNTTSIVVIRPLIPAGPILRGFQFLNCSRLSFCAVVNKQIKALNVPNRIVFLISCDVWEINLLKNGEGEKKLDEWQLAKISKQKRRKRDRPKKLLVPFSP